MQRYQEEYVKYNLWCSLTLQFSDSCLTAGPRRGKVGDFSKPSFSFTL